MKKEKKKSRFKFPISVKTAIIIVLLSLVMVEVAMTFYSVMMSNNNENNQKQLANNMAGTLATVIDPEKTADLKNQVKSIVDTYDPGATEWDETKFAPIMQSESFTYLKSYLQDIEKHNSSNVDCFYISYVDTRGYFVYLVDSATGEDECPPGWIDPIYDMNKGVLTNPDRGFPAYITNTGSYGWLVTAGAPIYHNNEVVGYACVDISMTAIRARQASNIIRLFIYLLSSTVLIAIIGIVVVRFIFILPVRKLTKASRSYDVNNPALTHEIFNNLNIKTHDEIHDLAESMKVMEKDINDKIRELTELNEALISSQKETAIMTELANKDALTGVNSKIAYNNEAIKINDSIAKGNIEPFGIVMVDLNYLKLINDEHGHNAGDKALMDLCQIICDIFTHSPVYRVGGDEFVVIIRKNDYINIDTLINKFNDKIEENRHTLSAAIGYALFDPKQDGKVSDVFKKADEAMYVRKHQMKEEDGNL